MTPRTETSTKYATEEHGEAPELLAARSSSEAPCRCGMPLYVANSFSANLKSSLLHQD